MSDSDEFVAYPYPVASIPTPRKTPLVRVVENYTRSLPLKKITAHNRVLDDADIALMGVRRVITGDELDDDTSLLSEAADEVAYKIVGEAAEKILEEAFNLRVRWLRGGIVNLRFQQLIDAVIDEEGEYIKDEDDFDPVNAFIETPEPKYIAKANEENMKDEPYTGCEKKVESGVKQASERGTLDFLRSVEGRVLTVLEAALPDKEHRNAVKSLIKKEFRREMNRVNRQPDED
jgi:hypothetical protein